MGIRQPRSRRSLSSSLAFALVITLLPFLDAPPAEAQVDPWTVCSSDCDFTTISAALSAAAVDGDVIEVGPGDYTEAINIGSLDDLTILSTGGAAVTLISPPLGQVGVSVNTGSLTMRGFTIRGANRGGPGQRGGAVWVNNVGGAMTLQDSVVTGNVADEGGGIANQGTFALERSRVEFNSASSRGAGIYNLGTMSIVDSVIFANRTPAGDGDGGGIFHWDSGSVAISPELTVFSSEISDNFASGDGGGVALIGGILEMSNSTVSSNRGSFGGGISAGPQTVDRLPSTVRLNNVTVTANSTTTHGGGIHIDPSAEFSIANTAIVDNIPASQTTTGDCNGTALAPLRVDATSAVGRPSTTPVCVFDLAPGASVLTGINQFQPLGNNGGPTRTHIPVPGSVLIDSGSDLVPGSGYPSCEAVDQRGAIRPHGATCDIGAVEAPVITGNVPPVVTDPEDQLSITGDEVLLQIEATDADDDDLTYSAVGLPESLSINASTGLISGTLDTAGLSFPEVTVTDGTTPVVVDFVWDVALAQSGIAMDDEIGVAIGTPAAMRLLENDHLDGLGPVSRHLDNPEAVNGAIDCTAPSTGCVYIPPDGFIGTVSLTYQVRWANPFADGSTIADRATVTLDVKDTIGATGTATADGENAIGEWDDADTINFVGPGGEPGTLFVMNDGTDLYVAAEVVAAGSLLATDVDNSELRLGFDMDGNGQVDPGEDQLRVSQNGSIVDGSKFGPDEEVDDADGAVTLNAVEGLAFYEMRRSLTTSESVDVQLLPGSLTGIQFEFEVGCFGGTEACALVVVADFTVGAALQLAIDGAADGAVTAASLDMDSSTVLAGFAVGLEDIPSDRLMVGVDRITGAPLGSIGLADSPLGAIPLGAIPLGAIGTASTTVISDVRIVGGWEALLAGTSLEGRPLQTITLAEAFAAIPADRLAGLSLRDLDPASSPVGSVSIDTLLLGPNGGTASTPLGAIPLGAIPLGAIPLGAIPLGAIPLGAIGDVQASPLGAIPLGAIGDLAAAPLGAIPLGAIPLGSIPLGAIPLGAIPLGAIPLGAIPLGAIDVGGEFCAFHDATADPGETCADLGIDPLTTTVLQYTEMLGVAGEVQSTPLGAIPLGAIPLGAIPLGSIDVSSVPLGAIPLGAIPLGAIPLGAIPLGAIPLGSIDPGCGQFDAAECNDDTLLADYVALFGADATLASTPLGAIPLGAIPLGAIPLGAIPLGAIEVAGVPLGAIPLGAIDLRTSPLGAIPLGAIPLGAIPLGAITLGALPLGAIDTGCATCTDDTTLAEYLAAVNESSLAATPLGAIPLGSIPLGAIPLGAIPLGAINPADLPEDATLADVLDHLTIAFLGETEGGFGNLTFGELLVSILLAGDFPWEDLPLDQVETRDVAGQGGLPGPDTVTAFVEFTTDGPVDRVQVRIDPGNGFLYVPGSAVGTTSAEDAAIVVSPTSADGDFLFEVLGPFPSGIHKFEAAFFAPLRLGAGTFGASVGSGAPLVVAPETPEVVVLPGDAPDTAPGVAIEADVLYVGHIDTADDEDWFSIQAPPAGDRVAVYLSNIAGDIDLFMYRPETAVVGDTNSISSIPLGSIPIEDSGVDHTGDGSLSPEATADYSIDEGQTLAAVSTNRGDEPETVSLFSREAEQYLIQVSSYDTAASDSPYVLRVKYESAISAPPAGCAPRGFPAISGGSLPGLSGVSSLILHNPDRFNAIHGDGGVAAGLSSLAGSTNGAVVDIAAIPGVSTAFSAWDSDPCSVSSANDVAGAIVTWIQQTLTANPSIRDVTIVGSDEVIPFVRLEDTTVVANESTYVDGFDPDSALYAAHSTRHYLSDAPYGDLDPVPWLDRYAYVPELGVGRLVEEPEHIVGAIDTFLDAGGILSPQTAAVAGYDFLTDGAQAVEDALVANGLTDADANDALISETWSAADLLTGAYSPAADVISPNAHYDHYRALPAIENLNDTENNLFTIDDLPSDLTNRVVFTMGCHSGLSVPNGTGATNPTDWAEVYGAARAIYVGNTGYGYGDTATVALTERLMANFAASLDGTLTVGQALAQAKQDQFGRAGLYGVYDLKAIEESTLYGLPMWKVDTPGGAAADDPAVGPVTTDPVSGLDSAGFSVSPDFQQVTSPVGTYYAAEGETQFLHWRPIQPKVSIDATKEGKVATGVLLTGLETTDVAIGNAAFARPNTTSGSEREPEVETSGVVFPSTFAQIGTSTRLGPDGPSRRQFANLIPGQFRGSSSGAGGTQRLFDSVDGFVFYADDPLTVDWTPPRIERVNASVVGGNAVFEVAATDAQSGVSRVLVLYRSSASSGSTGSWTAVDLSLTSGVWTGAGPLGAGVSAPLDYLVQAVNDHGAVGVSTFKGEFHQAPAAPPAPDTTTVTCNGAECDDVWYDGPVTVSANSGTVDGAPFIGSTTLTSDGVYNVQVEGASFFVLIDATDPSVTVVTPSVGGALEQDEAAVASYFCTDRFLVSCVGSVPVGEPLDTSTGGVRTFSVTALDASGKQTVMTFDYYVAPVITEIVGPVGPVAIDTQIELTVEFEDAREIGHTTSFDWGDGTTTTVDTTDPVRASVGTHAYDTPGVYTVTVTVGGDGSMDTEVFEYVVVYDPSGGFVTGGGWIDSPSGAYLDDPDATGKATFGFVSRYVRGRTTPDGNAQFQFKTVDLEFKSTSYDWLVIAGPRAQFQGHGTVNGALAPSGEPYRFFIVGIDGALTGDGDTDQFRIKIWYSDSGSDIVVYDNKRGASDNANDATVLGGGSIVIHQQPGGGGGRGR